MPMKRTSLFLDETLLAALARVAKRRGVSVAAIVREAAAAYVAAAPVGRPLPSFTGKYRSGRSDLSERAEELLWNDPHG